jgi:hypothetical protein
LYFSFFSASSCTAFLSTGIATSIRMHVFFFYLIIISGLFAITSLSMCISWYQNTVTSSCSRTDLGVRACVCVCTTFLLFLLLLLLLLLLTYSLLLYLSTSASKVTYFTSYKAPHSSPVFSSHVS